MDQSQNTNKSAMPRNPHANAEKKSAVVDAAVQIIGSGVGGAVGAAVAAKVGNNKK